MKLERVLLPFLALSLGLFSAPLAHAQGGRREATPNIGFLFPRPRRAPPDNSARVATALKRYHATQRRLLAADVVNVSALAATWRGLTGIRVRLERLERANRLSADADLCRELTRLLEHPVQLSMVGDDAAVELLRIADDRRLKDLLGIAQLANRRLGFHIQDVLGVPLSSGQS